MALNPANTRMFREAAEAPACIARQAVEGRESLAAVGVALRELSPRFLTTIARGSSDHAATYAKYLIETAIGIPVASFAPSVSSIYEAGTDMRGAACIAISQSGKSPDLIAAMQSTRDGGALSAALVNDIASPLGQEASFAVPLYAFPENAVAATKSYLASLALIARLTASWSQDAELDAALEGLPSAMDDAWALDWSEAESDLTAARSLFVIGRGAGLGIAQEAALKLKETCRIHAEAYSAAEVLHGPAAVVRKGFPILAFAQDDASQNSIRDTCAKLADMGARVFIAGAEAPGCIALHTVTADPRLQPILLAQAFYRLVNSCAVQLGENPDAPPHLMKVTETR